MGLNWVERKEGGIRGSLVSGGKSHTYREGPVPKAPWTRASKLCWWMSKWPLPGARRWLCSLEGVQGVRKPVREPQGPACSGLGAPWWARGTMVAGLAAEARSQLLEHLRACVLTWGRLCTGHLLCQAGKASGTSLVEPGL